MVLINFPWAVYISSSTSLSVTVKACSSLGFMGTVWWIVAVTFAT